jgi:hypothetical protein
MNPLSSLSSIFDAAGIYHGWISDENYFMICYWVWIVWYLSKNDSKRL